VIEKSGQLSGLSQTRVRLSGGVRGAQGKTRRLKLRTYNLTHDDGLKKKLRCKGSFQLVVEVDEAAVGMSSGWLLVWRRCVGGRRSSQMCGSHNKAQTRKV
jgi:hypothetical protein